MGLTENISTQAPFAEQPDNGVSTLTPEFQQPDSFLYSARLALSHGVAYVGDKLATNFRKPLPYVAAALAIGGTGVYDAFVTDPAPAAETASALPSSTYLQKDCPIVVGVAVPQLPKSENSGLSVQGKQIDGTGSGPIAYNIKYTWELSKRDKFCGIVAMWGGPRYRVLQPTQETAHSGDYVENIGKYENPDDVFETLFVYAKPAAGQK